jgi:hypothetical protein
MLQRTMRMTMRSSCLIVFLLAASFAMAQTEFSAEMVDMQKPDHPSNGKMYFSKDKVRVEPAKKDPRGGAVIINMTTQTVTILMDQMHMYMEMSSQTAGQRSAYNFFRTGDVEAACSDWTQLPQNKGGSCHKVGNETVNGRSTTKYEATNAKGDTSAFWLDPKLRFPVKWQGKNAGWELQNIQEGPQAASLFDVPAGYTKMDMGNMGGMMQKPQ